jgi:F0F1-type ATP synthase membrane subunit b/b'
MSKVSPEQKNNNFYLPLAYVSLGLLTLGVFTSKEILVFNEETLVAISFILFMIFAYRNLNDVFVAELEERATKIKKEFDHYFSLREDLLDLLISYHGIRKMLSNEITEISNVSKNEIKNILVKRQKALENSLSLQIQQKLRTILLKELSIVQQIQQETSHWFSKYVFASFQTQKTSPIKDIMIREGIHLIDAMSKYSSIQGKSLSIGQETKKFLNNLLVLHRMTHIPMETLLIGYLCQPTNK